MERTTTDAVREPRDGRRARQPAGAGRRRWLLCPRPDPQAGLRLYCLPYAGGRAAGFRGLAAELPSGVELGAVELPGHGARVREVPHTRLRLLVEHVTDQLAERVDKPYVLFGYSMGALLAFEVACELAARRCPGPRAVFVAAAEAPAVPQSHPPIHDLPRPQLLERVAAFEYAGNALLRNEELAEVMLPVLRADLAVCETYHYRPGRSLDVPLVAYGGEADTHVSRAGLEAWRERTSGEFSAIWIPGGHFFLDSSRAEFTTSLGVELARFTDGQE